MTSKFPVQWATSLSVVSSKDGTYSVLQSVGWHFKVEFNIAENNVSPIEVKKIIIRVVDENGQVLYDVNRGSGTFLLNGKEEFYAEAQEVLFDNTRRKLSFPYDKGSEYASGTYKLTQTTI